MFAASQQGPRHNVKIKGGKLKYVFLTVFNYLWLILVIGLLYAMCAFRTGCAIPLPSLAKSNLHDTCGIMPKRVTSSGIRSAA